MLFVQPLCLVNWRVGVTRFRGGTGELALIAGQNGDDIGRAQNVSARSYLAARWSAYRLAGFAKASSIHRAMIPAVAGCW